MNINEMMNVKTLKKEFNSEFGLTLRVYDGRSFADDEVTLASISKGDVKDAEFSPKKNMKIGNFEDKFQELFGIKVQIAGSDDSYLCNNDYTLAKALEMDEKRIAKKENTKNDDESIKDEIIKVEYRGPIHHYRIYQAKKIKKYSLSDELSNDADIKLIIEKFLTDTWDGCYEPEFTNNSKVPDIFGHWCQLPLTTKGSWNEVLK